MDILKIKIDRRTEHLEHIVARLSRHQLEAIILESIAKRAAITLGRPGVSTKIRFEDETEGSPAYRVGTKAEVSITIDHAQQDKVATERPAERDNG